MKTITISRIRLLNFKGVRDMDVHFTAGGATTISGRNGSGKTTIFDAFTWTLFGKDSRDRKQFDIKTLDGNGEAIPRLPHEVTVVLNVDGQEVTLQRRFTEKWTKRRGSAREEFTGHEEERLYNEVPCSLKEWNEKIAGICPEQVFRFITNPEYFTAQKWETQRDLLMRMAGGVSDADVAGDNKDFARLLSDMTGKTMEEYKREIGAKKKIIREEIEGIPGRIDERMRDMAEDIDFAALRREVKEKNGAIADIDLRLTGMADMVKRENERRQRLNEQKWQLEKQAGERETALREETYKSYWEERKAYDGMKETLAGMRRELRSLQEEYADGVKEVADMIRMREELIAEHKAIMAETLEFSETAFVCPTCGRTLEIDDIERKQREMTENFNERKARRLAENREKGARVNKTLIADRCAATEALKTRIEDIASKISGLENRISEAGEPQKPSGEGIRDDEGLRELRGRIADIEAEIARPQQEDEDRQHLLEARKMMTESVAELQRQLAREETNKANRKRVRELEASLTGLNEELARLEGIEFTMAAFTKARIEAVEQKINSLFTAVTFRMYERQINGGEVEKCEAMVDGVPYSSANNAGRINAGLDIINAICRHQGINAPIFIDNCESVLEPMETLGQQVRLVVADRNLIIS